MIFNTLAYILLLNHGWHNQNYWLACREGNLKVISYFFCGSGHVIPNHVCQLTQTKIAIDKRSFHLSNNHTESRPGRRVFMNGNHSVCFPGEVQVECSRHGWIGTVIFVVLVHLAGYEALKRWQSPSNSKTNATRPAHEHRRAPALWLAYADNTLIQCMAIKRECGCSRYINFGASCKLFIRS